MRKLRHYVCRTAELLIMVVVLFGRGCDALLGFGRKSSSYGEDTMSVDERLGLRNEVLEAYRHAYGSYIAYAYPADELMPLSCRGRDWRIKTRGTIDDVLGGYGLTMVDSLDMHAVVGDGPAFREAVTTVIRDFDSGVLSFDRDIVVSVFEASIRVLGGLLSAHQIATELEPGGRLGPPGWYKGELLELAYDLGKRLLPAFDTNLGIPVHRVNLRRGIPRGETRDTCSAAAGTFLLEFGALSRLTGNPSFERAARRSVEALWTIRSPLGLVGGGVDGAGGVWNSGHASIGAGTDSFYEYLHKSEKLLGDRTMGCMFEEAYGAVEEHLSWRGWHVEMDLYRGNQASPFSYRVSALQAFWPAVQASAGDVEAAENSYDALFGLWQKHKALPDIYDVLYNKLLHYGRDSPLRPELAESTLALFQATGKTRYLRAGADLLQALQNKSRVGCGYAAVGDVKSGAVEDRMDSFFIAETLKYLFLLFDSSLPSEHRRSIFCTPEQEASSGEHASATAPKQNSTELANNASSTSAATAVGTSGNNAHRRDAVPSVLQNDAADPRAAHEHEGENPEKEQVLVATEIKAVSIGVNGDTSGAHSNAYDKLVNGASPATYDGTCKNPSGADDSEGVVDGTVRSTEETQPAEDPASTAAAPHPQCIMWSNTVISTEGHPLLIEPLAQPGGESISTLDKGDKIVQGPSVAIESGGSGSTRSNVTEERNARLPETSSETVGPESAATAEGEMGETRSSTSAEVNTSINGRDDLLTRLENLMERFDFAFSRAGRTNSEQPFEPSRYYKPAIEAGPLRDAPKEAEFEIRCSWNGKCRFHDSGPLFLSYLKKASGGRWTRALSDLCNWVNEEEFSVLHKGKLREGEGVTYRLYSTMPYSRVAEAEEVHRRAHHMPVH